ncbi:MAG: A/G-specific adenine glycosylase [Candidatus Pacebacteria bacterium]|nr:A/G-specific adenine glycosylase [Candidatus Paceibacterota bacterium]
MTETTFKKRVWAHYKKHGRTLPWRPISLKETRDRNFPYRVLVSEIMLQQTQVDRVIPKFDAFIKKFPSFQALTKASTGDVLRAWQGLGYNRRALALKRTAELIVRDYKGILPSSEKELIALPGIGTYTAGALRAFVFNEPSVIIETNIRTVYIHHYAELRGQNADKNGKIRDDDLLVLIGKTLDTKNPREWYWALMDYGSYLKKEFGNASQKSKHYTRQSKFEGSRRQVRGAVLRALLQKPKTISALMKELKKNKEDVASVLIDLKKEGFVQQKGRTVSLM